jgi:hypothetical protein
MSKSRKKGFLTTSNNLIDALIYTYHHGVFSLQKFVDCCFFRVKNTVLLLFSMCCFFILCRQKQHCLMGFCLYMVFSLIDFVPKANPGTVMCTILQG